MSALTGLRIIELAEGMAGEYCGKLLAGLGADVIKVERPGRGSPTRAMAPLLDVGSDPERSGLFAYLNTNKRSVTGDLNAIRDLLASADAVIDDHDPVTTGALAAEHPGVVFGSVTPFGAGAPAELQNSKSLNIFQAGCSGTDPRPPR